MKIRTRLTLQFILICAGIFALALLFIFKQFKQHIDGEFFTHLENRATMIATMVLRHEESVKPITLASEKSDFILPSVGNTTVYDENFDCVFTVNTSAQAVSHQELRHIYNMNNCRFVRGNYQAFGTIMSAPSGKKYIVVAEDIADYSKLNELGNILLFSFLLVILAVATGGWFYAGQALKPVSRIVQEAEAILPSDLSKRIKIEQNKDELFYLVGTFNRLLDRIEYAFQMQKSFISNVSHELKNPIAIMDAQLQFATNKPRSIEEYEKILFSLQEDVTDITNTAEKLLQLARLNSDVSHIEFSEIRLDELLYQSRTTLLKANPHYQIFIEIKNLPENEKQLYIQGNEFLLHTALMNLMDNGCKFSIDHKVWVTIDITSNKKFQIEIKDKGVGISENDLPHIFEPFYRGAQRERKKGSGIGLSLVKSILDLHHIDIKVTSLERKGSNFFLSFPIVKQDNEVFFEEKKPLKTILQIENKAFLALFFSKISKYAFLILLLSLFFACNPTDKNNTANTVNIDQSFEVIQQWNGALLDIVKKSDGYSPPVSARMYAYMGIAAWEASMPTMPSEHSIVPPAIKNQLPRYNGKEPLILPISINATYSAMAKFFIPLLGIENEKSRIALEKKWKTSLSPKYSVETIQASEKFGQEVAETIFKWSATDSISHQAFLFNYNPNYKPKQENGKWQVADIYSMPALLPNWGGARTFVVDVKSSELAAPIPFSENPNSAFFAQAMEIYTISKPMTEEKNWVAEFWSDDTPLLSFCPSSRWIAIARQALNVKKADYFLALNTYLRLGLALNDTAVKVWYEKYNYNIERPQTYIQRNIDATWQPLHDAPSFPSYPSGHAAFGAAATAILKNILGKNLRMTDYSHENDATITGKPRHFNSLDEMCKENAISRLYMGVHYRMDCEAGLQLGKLIGQKIATQKLEHLGM
jgi:signal transduction histidine kinase